MTSRSNNPGDRVAGRRGADNDVVGPALAASAKGDQEAFALLYDEMSRIVYGVIFAVVRNEAIAEEIAQDAFVQVWKQAPNYDPARGSAKSWITTIAHRRAVDRVRSEQSRRDREDRDFSRRTEEVDTTSEAVIDLFEQSQVHEGLVELTPPQREAVEMAYFQGKTYREVATTLGIAEGTAKTRIRDGLIRLRTHYGVLK